MLTTDDRVKICDFGIARRLSAKSNNDTSDAPTPDWTFAGTPAYMAPEVILSYQFDERADLFSLGTVFYEVLTGRNPFLAATSPATTARVVSEQPAPMNNPAIGRKLETIVMRLLEKDPAKRFANAGELLTALEIIQRSRNRFVALFDDARAAFGWSAFKIVTATLLCVIALSAVAWRYSQPLRDWIIGPPLPDKKIVVILPFRVVGDTRDAGEGFYSEGVSVVLTDRLKLLTLNAINNLQVITPDEITARGVDSAEKARGEFGATIILSGTLLFSKQDVRLSYQLIRGSDLVELRRSSQSVEVGDPFALQDRVTRDLLTMLEIELTPPASKPLQVFGTRQPRAFFLYTEGKGALRNSFEPKNIDLAIELLTQALEVDPQYASGYAAVGQAYWLKFQHFNERTWIDQALKACENALAFDERLSEAHSCIGIVREAQGYYELAIDEFNQAIKYSAINGNAHQGLGRVLEALGRYDEAEKAYLRAIELSPQYWANQMWIASFYNRRHDYVNAVDHYRQALAISPENGQVYYSLGGAYANNGQFDLAIPVLKRAIELRPYLPEPYSNLGLTYIRLHQYQEAIPLLEKAVTLGKDHRVTGNLARVYWLTNQPEKAIPRYELAIRQAEDLLQLNPKDHAVHLLVGRYYAMLRKQTDAISHITIALNLHRDDPHYLMIAAVAYLQMGDRASALGMLEQAAITRGFTSAQIIDEPELDALKNEPRYVALTANNKKRQ
jgi:serine/threonine-protein kinase